MMNKYRDQLRNGRLATASFASPSSSSSCNVSVHLRAATAAQRTQRRRASVKGSETTTLSPEEWDMFKQKYADMDHSKKWEIEEGVYVEDEMYNHVLKEKCCEHAAHSGILHLGDKCWKSVFTPSQLKKIEGHQVTPLPEPPASMKNFFEQFKGVSDINELWKIAEDARFDPVTDFDADWAKRSILDILCAYRWDVISRIGRHGKERDLIMRVYRVIDLSFDNLYADIQRSDQQSIASSTRTNEARCGPDGSIQQKVVGVKPDMIISKGMLEYGSAEHGYDDEGGVGSKELFEKYLKLPKTMKDMMLQLGSHVNNDAKRIRQLKVVGFCHTHLRTTSMMMDVPTGYICRIKPLKERKIPLELTDFYHTIIPFLLQAYRIKQIVKSTMEFISGTASDDDDSDDGAGYDSLTNEGAHTLTIPSVLNRVQPTPRKRKASELDSVVSSISECK